MKMAFLGELRWYKETGNPSYLIWIILGEEYALCLMVQNWKKKSEGFFFIFFILNTDIEYFLD